MSAFLRLAAVPDSFPATTTVALVEAHQVMRAHLRALLDGEPDIDVIMEIGAPRDVTFGLHPAPEVLVLDVSPADGRSTLAVLERIRVQQPDIPIVALTTHEDLAFVRHAFGCGALGVVLKEMADSDLPAAIRAAFRRQRYASPKLATTT